MDMLTDSYNLRDIQMFLYLLTSAEVSGITDARFLRQHLSEQLLKRAGSLGRIRKHSRVGYDKLKKCPSCDQGYLTPRAEIEGLKRIGCGVCYYSEVVA